MAFQKRKKTRYDEDYDVGRSFDDYDYGKRLEHDDDTVTLESDEDDESAEFGRILFWNAVNNSALYVAAYFLMFVVYQLATAGIAYRRFMNSVIRYYITNVTPYHGLWLNNRKTIVWIYTAGPVACFLIAVVIYLIYLRWFQKSVSLIRPFMLWMTIIGSMMAFGGLGAGILVKDSYRGFGYAVAWAGNTMAWRYFYIGLAVVFMLLLGFLTVKAFLQTATRSDMVRRRGGARLEFLFFSVLIPYGVGSMIVAFTRLPALEYYEIISMLFFIPTLLAMFSYGRQISTLRLVRSLDDLPISKIAIGMALVLLLAVRIILDPGIRVDAFPEADEKNPNLMDQRK